MSEVSVPPLPPKEKKGLEETVSNLRRELRSLYESLAEKNDQLSLLERDVRDRDSSVKFLRSEFHKLREQHSTNHHQKISSSEIDGDKKKNAENGNTTVANLQKRLTEHEQLVKELTEKIIRLSHDLTYVQRKSFAKDDRIVELQNEIDKFRQIVRPLTQAMLDRKRSESYDDFSPGVESTRILPMAGPPRMKRTAISAEPLSSLAGMEGDLVKIPKSSL